MTTFWIVTGVVVALVLIGAWLYDRKWGVDPTRMPSPAKRAEAETQGWISQQGASHGGDSF
jgi:hypothetical protein